MPLEALTISNFRSLKSVELTLNSGLNFFYGDNGAGKTSVLECISLVGTGRSFKTRKHSNLPTFNHRYFTLVAKINKNDDVYKVGISRGNEKDSKTLVNSDAVSNSSVLAELLPLRSIDTHSLELLEGSPSIRRSYLDWLMFHVKHNFKALNKEYTHCLKQRNALLRHDKIDGLLLSGWTNKLIEIGSELQKQRVESLPALENGLNKLLKNIDFLKDKVLKLRYIDGNKAGADFKESLSSSKELDQLRGFTNYGPHKADLVFTVNNKPIAEVLSRGQLKSVVYALYLAQIQLAFEWVGVKVSLLLDDISSELDEHKQKTLADWVEELDIQVFITGITKEDALRGWSTRAIKQSKMFHVKHGEITEEPHDGEMHD